MSKTGGERLHCQKKNFRRSANDALHHYASRTGFNWQHPPRVGKALRRSYWNTTRWNCEIKQASWEGGQSCIRANRKGKNKKISYFLKSKAYNNRATSPIKERCINNPEIMTKYLIQSTPFHSSHSPPKVVMSDSMGSIIKNDFKPGG